MPPVAQPKFALLNKKMLDRKLLDWKHNANRVVCTIYEAETTEPDEKKYVIGMYTGFSEKAIVGAVSTGIIKQQIKQLTAPQAWGLGKTADQIMRSLADIKSDEDMKLSLDMILKL